MKATKETATAAACAACLRFVDAARQGMDQVFDATRVGVLRLAAERGPIRPSDIALELDVGPSTVTRQVQALHAAEQVSVAADPKDGRAFLVEATAAGRKQLKEFDEIGLQVFSAVVEQWSDEELRQLTTLLDKMIQTWASRGEDQRREVHGRKLQGSEPWWAGS
jgi:DNA-binding MarR family transcriptional regulator